jgi:hypothetical protein
MGQTAFDLLKDDVRRLHFSSYFSWYGRCDLLYFFQSASLLNQTPNQSAIPRDNFTDDIAPAMKRVLQNEELLKHIVLLL